MIATSAPTAANLGSRSSAGKQYLYSVASLREMDRATWTSLGISSFALMQRAGQSVANLALARWPLAQRIAIWCGPGNNGGDGFIAAIKLIQAVRDVAVYADRLPNGGDALLAYQQFIAAGGMVLSCEELNQEALRKTDLLIDALYGIGGRSLLANELTLAQRINASNVRVLAIDVPSGLNADTGHVGGASNGAIRAHCTLTMIALKAGLFTGQARDLVGDIVLDELAMPSRVAQAHLPIAHTQARLEFLPKNRKTTAHKGHHGHVLCLGGDHGMPGAIRLCAEAALRAGAGLVTVATRAEHLASLQVARPELMLQAAEQIDALFSTGKRYNVLAIGPGLGTSHWGAQLFAAALSYAQQQKLAVVLDADALNLLANKSVSDAATLLPAQCVLTPHPGEAARLLRCQVNDIERDRYAAAQVLSEKYQATVVLKGAGSLVANRNQITRVCVLGNAGMATGGMGDVLTGTIAAFLAQGLDPWQAACDGVTAHAYAGDYAARDGARGMLASDVIAALRHAVNEAFDHD